MDSNERRKKILEVLNKSDLPIKGSKLAEQFNVSRQIIVQDIALIRAGGNEIIATPQGYIVYSGKNKIIKKEIKCKNHKNYDEVYNELKIIVDRGGIIENVIVNHPIYGEIKAILNISSAMDINSFMTKMKNNEFKQLSSLTMFDHVHTIQALNEDIMLSIIKELKDQDVLAID